MGLAFPPSLSPSSVSAFTSCPLAFKFSYIDRLPAPPSPAATKGTLVHRALELLMLRSPDDRTVDAALVDLEKARVEMADDPDLAGLELTDEQRAQFDADAEELVRRYFQLEDPRTVNPNGLELKLTAQFGRVTLRGIIDRLELDDDGQFVVTDYKTGSVPSEYAENMRLSGVHIYAALCERMLGRRPSRVQLYYLSKPEAIIATPTAQSVAGSCHSLSLHAGRVGNRVGPAAAPSPRASVRSTMPSTDGSSAAAARVSTRCSTGCRARPITACCGSRSARCAPCAAATPRSV